VKAILFVALALTPFALLQRFVYALISASLPSEALTVLVIILAVML
jgi:hypothetical protein